MQDKLKKIKSNPELTLIADELDKVASLEAVYLSKGGQLLFRSLMTDVCSAVDKFISKFDTMTNQEFVAIASDIKTKLELARTLKKSKRNKLQAEKDLEEALLEYE